MLIKRPSDLQPSEITPHGVYLRRREFVAAAGALALGAVAGVRSPDALAQEGTKLKGFAKSKFSTAEKMNGIKDVSGYVNYYEFGTDKSDPPVHAKRLKVQPWTVVVEGEEIGRVSCRERV